MRGLHSASYMVPVRPEVPPCGSGKLRGLGHGSLTFEASRPSVAVVTSGGLPPPGLGALNVEFLRQASKRELLAELAGAVLVGEHALLPVGLRGGPGVDPPHGEHPFGVVVTSFGGVAVLALQGESIKCLLALGCGQDGLVEAHRGPRRLPDTHVARLRDVDPDAGAHRDRV